MSESNQVLTELACAISKRGLTPAAIFLLEMHKPLWGSAKLLLEACGPIISLTLGKESLQKLIAALDSSDTVELLIKTLEGQRR